jgi:tetratricopeptide (TPR) repeat protein
MTARPTLALLALVLTVSPLATADPGPMLLRSPAASALLDEGRAQMVAYRLADAEATFARLAALEPGSAAAAFHLAKIAWWRAITMEQEPLYDAFMERSDAVLETLRTTEDGPWKNHFQAETELFRASIHAKRGQYARAAMALRRAYLNFQRNGREHPDFHESRWGMGLCQAAVGSVPSKYQWLMRLFGFRGTIAEGLREIEASIRHSRYFRDEAAVYHAVLDLTINESRAGGARHLRAAQARNPDAPPLQYLLAFSHLNDRRPVEAERLLRRALATTARPGVYPIPYLDYYLGDALFRQNRFEEAARHFEAFISGFPGRALRAQAALLAGLSREMSGDRAAAERHYRAISVREDYDSDASARREADVLLRGPMTRRQRALLLGRNAFDGGRYREAVSAVQEVLTDAGAPAVERAEAAYRSGRAYQLLEDWPEALRHFQYAVSNPGDPLAKWGPWSQFYMGEVHAASGDRPAARLAYERALANRDPFEYSQALEQRARAALEQL